MYAVPGGVGLFLKPNERQELEIVRLAKGGSAERSGQILPGDIVFEVDGDDVYKKEFNVFAKLIQGPVGTFVEVKVFKQGDYSRVSTVVLERTLNPEDSRPAGGEPMIQGSASRGPEPPRGGLSTSMAGAADIGIDFKTDETGCFQITALKPGGPAAQSGVIDVGDILYEIEGVKVLYGIGPNGRPLSNIEISEMLRGPEGSAMNLRLQKGRMGRLATANLTRTAATKTAGAPPPPPPQQASPVQQQDTLIAQTMANQSRSAATPPQPAVGPASQMYGTQQSNNYQEPLFPVDQQTGSMMQSTAPKFSSHGGRLVYQSGRQGQNAQVFRQPDYVHKYNPSQPDRLGLGIVFQPYGQGQIRVKELIEGGPAQMSGEPIRVGDWLYEIDGKMVFKQPVSQTLKILQAKQKGDPIHLGLRHGSDRHLTGVMLVKSNTGVKLSNAGIGIVFKQDTNFFSGWVRVAQVIPGGPAINSVGDSVIRVNDRVIEVNGVNVSQQELKNWQHMLRGKEGTSCVLTLADVNADLYTCNIIRGYVDQSVVDQNSINVPAPLFEAPIKSKTKFMAPDKKYLPNLSGVSCGISFLQNDDGEVVVDHVQAGGPAASIGKINAGDVLLEIGDGPDVDPLIFPMKDVYKLPIDEWSEVIKKGIPQTHAKFVFKKADSDEKYEAVVKRELLVDLETGQERLYTVGIAFAAHGKTVYIDQGGIMDKSSARKEGIRPGYILKAIEREAMTGKIDDLQSRMNELLIGPKNTPVNLIFQTASGNYAFRVMRDVPLKMTPTRGAPQPRQKIQPPKAAPTILPYNTSGLGPGSGIYTQPMSNPVLWASLVEEGEPMDGDDTKFQWRGRILKQPEYDEHSIATVTDAITNELIYRGPGIKEKRLPGMKLPSAIGRKTDSAQPATAPPAAPAQRSSPAPPAAPAAPAAPAPPSPPPAAAAAPAAPPAGEGDEDDERVLTLTDGRTVEAKKLEDILKKHLDAVAYVMVVGSKKQFLSCMLTLKTHGSEAASRGEDPKSVPNPFDLAAPALALAQKVGSAATNVHQARQDTAFRANGLLPGFSAANQEIGDNAMQVRRFSILTSFFTVATGELNADGSLARLKIKKTHKHIIEGMYNQQKKPAGNAPPQ